MYPTGGLWRRLRADRPALVLHAQPAMDQPRAGARGEAFIYVALSAY